MCTGRGRFLVEIAITHVSTLRSVPNISSLLSTNSTPTPFAFPSLQFSYTPLTFFLQLTAPRGLCRQILARVDSQSAIIILASALVTQSSSVIFAVRLTDTRTSTLSRCLGHLPHASPASQGAELCRYTMKALEKIQSPRVPHSQRPIHTYSGTLSRPRKMSP